VRSYCGHWRVEDDAVLEVSDGPDALAALKAKLESASPRVEGCPTFAAAIDKKPSEAARLSNILASGASEVKVFEFATSTFALVGGHFLQMHMDVDDCSD
jgi:hypothetical protein